MLGEMLELGEGSAAHHRGLAPLCESLDLVFCVGSEMAPLAEKLGPDRCIYHQTPDASLIEALLVHLRPGTSLLIKGSNRVFWARDYVARIEAALTS